MIGDPERSSLSSWLGEEHGYKGAVGVLALVVAIIWVADVTGKTGHSRSSSPNSAGKQYVQIAAPLDTATATFRNELERWTAATPHAQMLRATSTLAASSKTAVLRLVAVSWPAVVKPLVGRFVLDLDALGSQARRTEPVGSAAFGRWQARWSSDLGAARTDSHRVLSSLHLPDPDANL